MADQVLAKYLTTHNETYCHPYNMPAHRAYMPSRFTHYGDNNIFTRNMGTKEWFHEYRRSVVAEKQLTENLQGLENPVYAHERFTTYSDDKDRVLGDRSFQRDLRLYKPDYHLNNRLPDRERDRGDLYKDAQQHREQYKDTTGTLHHQKVGTFHDPTKAEFQFTQRIKPKRSQGIWDYPNSTRTSLEYSYHLNRGPKMWELWPKA